VIPAGVCSHDIHWPGETVLMAWVDGSGLGQLLCDCPTSAWKWDHCRQVQTLWIQQLYWWTHWGRHNHLWSQNTLLLVNGQIYYWNVCFLRTQLHLISIRRRGYLSFCYCVHI